MKTLLFPNFAAPAILAVALSLLALPTAAQTATVQDRLSDEIEHALATTAVSILKTRSTGQGYLKQSGLNLVLVFPSMDTMLEQMRKAHASGELDEESLRAFEQAVKATPAEKRQETKYRAVGPGFEPSTTLQHPYGVRMRGGSTLIFSDGFVQKFQVITKYDMQRLIRNASIILTDFGAGIEHDNFPTHKRRLVEFFGSGAALDLGLGEQSYARDVFLLTAAFMALEYLFLREAGAPLTTEEHYAAAVIVGQEFQIFK